MESEPVIVPTFLRNQRTQKTNAIEETKVEPVFVHRKPIAKKRIIRLNYWDNFEDPETGIVFDHKTSTAYGVQESDGKISELTDKHIKLCERYGWKFENKEQIKPEFDDSWFNVSSSDDEHRSDDDDSSSEAYPIGVTPESAKWESTNKWYDQDKYQSDYEESSESDSIKCPEVSGDEYSGSDYD